MVNTGLIKKAFERDMGKRVLAVTKRENLFFNINSVFKIETEDGAYIFKLYRSAGYPEEGKMPFVAQKLAAHGVPHATIYAYNRTDDIFPNGYIIEECLPGTAADRLALSEAELCRLYKRLGAAVSDIHKIKLARYGFIVRGVPDCATFTEHIERHFVYGAKSVCAAYTKAELDKIKRTLVERLRPCDDIPPCLCHIDIQLKNIVADGERITLIDWDDARSFPAAVDIARLTLLIELAYDSEEAEDTEKAEAYKKAFLGSAMPEDELKAYRQLEPALHAWHGLVLLNFCAGGSPQFSKIKTALDEKIRQLV